jgi:hypothetical protein
MGVFLLPDKTKNKMKNKNYHIVKTIKIDWW